MASLHLFAAEAAVTAFAAGPQLSEDAFRTRAFQAEEDAAIWTRAWVCVGFDADIPERGDVLPFTVGNHGIHVERLADGSLAARFNKAQHGGCRAVPLQCQTGAKTKCSFTACGYSRDRGPILADDPARDTLLDQYFGLRPERLLPVAVQAWGSLIVAQLDPMRVAPLAWGNDPEIDPMVDLVTEWVEIAANWKLVAAAFAGNGEAAVCGVDRGSFGTTTILFPNLIIVEQAAATYAIVLQPTALKKTLCRVRTLRAANRDIALTGWRAVVDVAAAAADRWTRDVDHPCASTPARRWFDARVAQAVNALCRERATGPLYRTNDQGSW